MNKKIKGYEVMKLIAEKQIKVGQEFLFTNADGVKEKIFWDGENFKYSEAENSFVLRTVSDIEFALGDFEILEDEEEIDINDLEDLPLNYKEVSELSIDSTFIDFHNNTRAEINKIIKYLKQLDKKINKEE